MKRRRISRGATIRAQHRPPTCQRTIHRQEAVAEQRAVKPATGSKFAHKRREEVAKGKGRWIRYSDDELAWLEANCTLPAREYHAAFNAAFGREIAMENLARLRQRKGWATGRTGRFAKGSVPANKGKSIPFNANSAATRFKAGVRRGIAVKLYKPIGAERLSKEGYLERKIHDGLPLQSRWRAVHLIRWEALHGPVPKGFCLKSLDSTKSNTDPSNWELIPRAVLARLNGGRHKKRLAYDDAAPELKPVVLAAAKLSYKARTAREGQPA